MKLSANMMTVMATFFIPGKGKKGSGDGFKFENLYEPDNPLYLRCSSFQYLQNAATNFSQIQNSIHTNM